MTRLHQTAPRRAPTNPRLWSIQRRRVRAQLSAKETTVVQGRVREHLRYLNLRAAAGLRVPVSAGSGGGRKPGGAQTKSASLRHAKAQSSGLRVKA